MIQNRKIAITGHMDGLGKGLYHSLSAHNSCVGFDLSNGYDIDKDIDIILEQSKDCEIFINNAYYLYRQTDLAVKWHKMHWDKKYFIINISSAISDPYFPGETIFPHIREYLKEKESLNQISAHINLSDSKCKSSLILPGMMHTKFATPHDTNQPDPAITTEFCQKIFDKECIMYVEDIVPIIESIIEQNFHPRRLISSIIIHSK